MKRWRIPILVALLGGIAVGALYVYNIVSDRTIAKQAYVPRPVTITPDVVMLQQYLRIDTSNPPGNETAGARFLAAQIERAGVHAEVIESAPGRGNVYARIRGKRPGEGLLLLNHIDVVPADNKGWTKPPFAGEQKLNALYGRGALDMKGIAICQLEAFLAVARRKSMPERDVIFLGTADEERGGTMGIVWLLAHRPDIFEGVRYALNEGGINESYTERPSYVGVEIGSKMVVRTELWAPSRAAMQQARIALEPYFGPSEPDRILPEVRLFLHDLAPTRIVQGRWLNDIDRTIAEGKFWDMERPYKEATQNIVWATQISGDAHGATMPVALFNLPDEDPDRRLAWLAETVRPYGARIEKVVEKTGPTTLSPRNTPLFALIASEAHRQWGNVPVGTEVLVAWYNDSRYLRPRGIICYGLWPFQVDFYQTQTIHLNDERVRIDWFQQGVQLMTRLVVRYAAER